jgi:hypothetical protein
MEYVRAGTRMKITLGMIALALAWMVLAPASARGQQGSPSSPAQAAGNVASEPADDIVYKDTKYGFTFSLPKSWTGYAVVVDKWEGENREKGAPEGGPMIRIRHPGWTKENRRQDIALMIFSLAQWEAVEQGSFVFGASGVGPSEIGRNRKYVFAILPRFNPEVAGVREVELILQHGPLHPIWSK